MRKYKAMFTTKIISSAFDNESVAKEIKWAKSVLKKEDRIVWYLRIYRFLMLRDSKNEAIQKYCECQLKKFEAIRTVDGYFGTHTELLIFEAFGNQFKNNLKHFMDLNIHSVDSIVFGDTGVTQLMDKMQSLEGEWRDTLRRELDESGSVFMTIGDYTWFNLECSGSALEGKAMGHCGNGAGRAEQLVYSLRSKSAREGKWIPHVTLILQDCKGGFNSPGFTGEIKGYGNQKPQSVYHDALVAFITSERVLGMQGGGYLAGNNFCVSDLSEEKREIVKQVKPELFPLLEHLADCDTTINDHAYKALVSNNRSVNKLEVVEASDMFNDVDIIDQAEYFVKIHSLDMTQIADSMAMPKLKCFSELLTNTKYDGCTKEEADLVRSEVGAFLRDVLGEKFPNVFFHFDKNCKLALYLEAWDFLEQALSCLLNSGIKENRVGYSFDNANKYMVDIAQEIGESIIKTTGSNFERVSDTLSKFEELTDINDIAQKYKRFLNVKDIYSFEKGEIVGSDVYLDTVTKAFAGISSADFGSALTDRYPEIGGKELVNLYSFSLREFMSDMGMTKALAYCNIAISSSEYNVIDESFLSKLHNILESSVREAFSFLNLPVYSVIDFKENIAELYVLRKDCAFEVRARAYKPSMGSSYTVVSTFASRLGEELIKEASPSNIDMFCEDNVEKLNFVDLMQYTEGNATELVLLKALTGLEKFVVTEEDGNACEPFIELFEGTPAEMASEFDMSELGYYAEKLDDGYFEHHGETSQTTNDVKHLIVECLDSCEELQQKAVVFLSDYLGYEEISRHDMDLLADQLLEADLESGEVLDSSIVLAISQAEESGAFDELSEAHTSCVKDLCGEIEGSFEWGDEYSVSIRVPLKAYVERIGEYYKEQAGGMDDFNEDCDLYTLECEMYSGDYRTYESDLNVPYYGFSGFNEDFCRENVDEALCEFLKHIELLKAA